MRTACAACGGGLRTVLALGATPVADYFPLPDEPDGPAYPLRMAVCERCWLAQLPDVVPDGELYGAGYGFLTGGSPAAVRYFAAFADWLMARYGERARRLTVEIACNDGTLLRHLAAAGCPVLGIEPAGPPAAVMRERGLDVWNEPFGRDSGKKIRDVHGPAGLVVAVNVAAHVADPVGFLAGIGDLLAPGGVAVLEFQDLAALVAGCQFDHVYHEHRFFYSLRSFTQIARAAGLVVVDAERSPAQGGSLRVTAARAGAPAPAVEAITGTESWLAGPGAYAALQPRAERTRERLGALLAAEQAAGRTVAGYAAPAKSATLLGFCGIGPDVLPWIVDATPSKAGRVTPGSRIPVVMAGERPDPGAYLLLAWNYLGDVLRRERAFMAAGGRFIVPIPGPVVL